jgi:hypothetical protein
MRIIRPHPRCFRRRTAAHPLARVVPLLALLGGPAHGAEAATATTTAEAAPAATDTPHLTHRRHLHAHGRPHPTQAPAEPRFFTTRSSDVVLPLPDETDAFVFAVFGDRTGGPPEGVDVLADAVRDVNLLEPDLVMTVGDLINGYNRTDEWMEQMREFKAIMNRLLCPWFPVAGNHDVYWRPLDDPDRPRHQHDEHYELHFGPLWYSFQHKRCNFIVLYSDESDPETGAKDFSDPALQKISAEQLDFLRAALERGGDCDHQFVFLHHPRWLGGGYGDDWHVRVHPLLVAAGNVTAVFAGHIHRMRYDPADGIEYVTLATVGGVQESTVPAAGYLHQYHLVTVRPKQVAMAAFPVGAALDVRELTGALQEETVRLARQPLAVTGGIAIPAAVSGGAADSAAVAQPATVAGAFTVALANPTSRPVDYTLTPRSRDPRWRFFPDHTHGTLEPGAGREVRLRASYRGRTIDESFEPVQVVLAQDYLAPTTRYAIPEIAADVPLTLDATLLEKQPVNRALMLDGEGDCVRVDAGMVPLPQGPLTLECWLRAKRFGERVGLLAKTESSEYGIFVSGGKPDASVFLGGSYRAVQPDITLEPGRWYHLAMVYDGAGVSFYLDGRLAGRTEVDPAAQRKPNRLPLFIGADTDARGRPTAFFEGAIDEVHLARGAKYREPFVPSRRLEPTEGTIVLYDFDRQVGPLVLDRGPRGDHARLMGDAHLVEVEAALAP